MVPGQQTTLRTKRSGSSPAFHQRPRPAPSHGQPVPSGRPQAYGRVAVQDLPGHPVLQGQDTYKTHVAAHFSHKDAKMEGFGYYLHLEPGSSSGGGGLWHPGTPALTMVRKNIAGNPERWKEARNGIKVHGESLKRPPQGYNPEHPLIKDLKRKDLYAMFPIPEQTVCSTDFPAKFAEQCAKITPLMSFLAKSTGLPW